MKKVLVTVLVVAMAVCLMVSCTGSGTQESPSAEASASESASAEVSEPAEESSEPAAAGDGEPLSLGAVVMDVQFEYHKNILDGGQYYCDEYGYKFTGVDGASDPTKQVTSIENMVQAGVQGIDVRMIDEAAFTDVVAMCNEKGVKLAMYPPNFPGADISLQNGDYENGYELGKTAGAWINEKYDGECEVAFISWSMNVYLLERNRGYEDGLAEVAPNAKIVAVEEGGDIVSATNAVESVLKAHPDIKVFLGIGDTQATAAAEVIDSDSSKNPEDYFVGGIDAEEHVVETIETGTSALKATVGTTMKPQTIAYEMMDQIAKAVRGEEYHDVVITPYVITKDTVDQYRTEVENSWPPKK